MSDPVSAAMGTSMGASGAQAALGAFSSILGGRAQSAMYNYQAGVAQINSQIARQDANYAIASGEVEAEQAGMRTRAEIGQTKAAFGAGNIGITGGSPARVIASEVKVGQENEGIIRANAAKRAYGFEVTAAESKAQAGALFGAAKSSRVAGEIGAISSIIGGAGQVSSRWLQAQPYFSTGGGSPASSDPTRAGSLY